MKYCILFLICSCASIHDHSGLPVFSKKYKNDLISVQSALNLAYSAYLKGCVDQSKSVKNRRSFHKCKKDARGHVRDNIVFILDQEPKINPEP